MWYVGRMFETPGLSLSLLSFIEKKMFAKKAFYHAYLIVTSFVGKIVIIIFNVYDDEFVFFIDKLFMRLIKRVILIMILSAFNMLFDSNRSSNFSYFKYSF